MTALVQFNTLVASIQQNGKECEDSLRRGYIGETCEASFYCCIKPETSKYGCLILRKCSNSKTLVTSVIQSITLHKGMMVVATLNTMYHLILLDKDQEEAAYEWISSHC